MPIPIPTPFPIPTPGAGGIDTSVFWDYDNISGMISMTQTVWVLINQHKIVSGVVAIAFILIVVRWTATFVGQRDVNI